MGQDCDICHGTRHIRRGGRWVRCACIRHGLSSFVHPTLRGDDREPPADAVLLPLDKVVASTGDWDAFRRRAWASLLAYEPQGITHDVVFFHRLSDIVTGREQEGDAQSDALGTIRDLVRLDILIIVISPYDIANRLTRSVLGNLLDERSNMRRATWVFSHLTGSALRFLLDDAITRRWFPSFADAQHAPASVGAASYASGPGNSAGGQPADAAGGGPTRRYR